MAPDWVIRWLTAFQSYVDALGAGGLVVGMALTVLAVPVMVLWHEVGHAVAVLARGRPLLAIQLGHRADLRVRVGGVVLQAGRRTPGGGAVGRVLWDPTDSTAVDRLVIAVAGPLASAVGTVVTLLLLLAGGHAPAVTYLLFVATLDGGIITVVNLRPRVVQADPPWLNDGAEVVAAWRHLRGTCGCAAAVRQAPDPRAATSFPPPGRRPPGSG